MKLSKEIIKSIFKVNDTIKSGGNLTTFKITEILDDRIRIKPTKAKTKTRLYYDKLSVIINNFEKVNPKQIEITVGQILAQHDLSDKQNESYLYGMAREYFHRHGFVSIESLKKNFEIEINNSLKSKSYNRKRRLRNAPKFPQEILVLSRAFKRNPDVVVEVLERANGVCEKCNSPAPFKRKKNKEPYLEVHHKKQLSKGGEDTVQNAIALCPNCHKKFHFG